jgi:PAS domain S-box-containing protein
MQPPPPDESFGSIRATSGTLDIPRREAPMTTDDASPDQGGEAPCLAHVIDQPRAATDELLVQLVHGLADAVVIAGVDGTITFWNEAAGRLFGWTAAEAIGQTLDLIVPERMRERHWAGYHQVMASGHTAYGDRLLEVPAVHRDGRRLSIAFTVTLLHEGGDSRPCAIAAVLRDDTARWQERRQLREEIARLTGNASQ